MDWDRFHRQIKWLLGRVRKLGINEVHVKALEQVLETKDLRTAERLLNKPHAYNEALKNHEKLANHWYNMWWKAYMTLKWG